MDMCIVITALAFSAVFQYTRIFFLFDRTTQTNKWSYWEKFVNIFYIVPLFSGPKYPFRLFNKPILKKPLCTFKFFPLIGKQI